MAGYSADYRYIVYSSEYSTLVEVYEINFKGKAIYILLTPSSCINAPDFIPISHEKFDAMQDDTTKYLRDIEEVNF